MGIGEFFGGLGEEFGKRWNRLTNNENQNPLNRSSKTSRDQQDPQVIQGEEGDSNPLDVDDHSFPDIFDEGKFEGLSEEELTRIANGEGTTSTDRQGAAPGGRQVNSGEAERKEQLKKERVEQIENFLSDYEENPMELAELLNKGCRLPIGQGRELHIHGLQKSVIVNGVNDPAIQLAIKFIDRLENDEQKCKFLRRAFANCVFNTDGRGNVTNTQWSEIPEVQTAFATLMTSPLVSRPRWVWFSGHLPNTYFVRGTKTALEDLKKFAQAGFQRGAQFLNADGRPRFGRALFDAENFILDLNRVKDSVALFEQKLKEKEDWYLIQARLRQEKFADFWKNVSGEESNRAVSLELNVELPVWVRGQLGDEFNGLSKEKAIFVGTSQEIDQEKTRRQGVVLKELEELKDKYTREKNVNAANQLSSIRESLESGNAPIIRQTTAAFFVEFNNEFKETLKGVEGFEKGYAVASDIDGALALHKQFAKFCNSGAADLFFGTEHQKLKQRDVESAIGRLNNEDDKEKYTKWFRDFVDYSEGENSLREAWKKLRQVEDAYKSTSGIRGYVTLNSVKLEKNDYRRQFQSEWVYQGWDLSPNSHQGHETLIGLGIKVDKELYKYDPDIPPQNQLTEAEAKVKREEARQAVEKNRSPAEQLVADYYESNKGSFADGHKVIVARLLNDRGGQIWPPADSVIGCVANEEDFLGAQQKLKNIALRESYLQGLLEPGATRDWDRIRLAEEDVEASKREAIGALKKIFNEIPQGLKLSANMLGCHGQKEVSSTIADGTSMKWERDSARGALNVAVGEAQRLGAADKILGYVDKDSAKVDFSLL